MLREYANELKNYNFLEKITEGYYIDAKDEGRWKVGKIQEIRKVGHKICIEVMFDGYSSKYNENYDLPSFNKLAPFRKYTLPYTGSSTQQPRREQPGKTLQHYIKVLNKCQNDLQSLKSEYINQFFRGQLFIFIDYCLTLSLKQEAKYPYEDYLRLFSTYLDSFGKILDKVIEFLQQNEKDCNLDQNYIYVHSKMALLYSITEFLFNCNSMISKRQDRVTFHSNFSRHIPQDQIYAAFYEKINQLKIYEKCQKLMNFKASNGTRSLPWSIKKQILILCKSINPEEKIKFPKQTKQVIEFLQYLPYLTKKYVTSIEQEQKYRNDLIFHLILNGNFEGKLIGLNEIKKLITSATYYNSYKKESPILQQIKQKNLIGYFLDNNNFNSELFKRSLIIFDFAYKNKLFGKDQFSAVLKLHKDKHQLQLQNFYNSLAEFGSFMIYEDVVLFFKMMIKQLPFEENFIEFVKNFTISTVEKNPVFKKIYMEKDQHGFGLIYFWDLINTQTKLSKELASKVIQSFAKLLNNIFFSRQIQRFIVSSIKAIKQLKNPECYLKVIHESLKICKGSRMNKAIETAQRQVNVIESAMTMLRQQENNLSRDGFENLFEFLQQVNYISRKGLRQGDILFLWKMDKAKCRSHLLRFLRKYKLRSNQQKSQQRIISKSLDLPQIQFIIKNIFQSPQLMEGYRQIDDDHYQTIDELILCYLHNKKIIEYNYKHTIRFRKNQYFTDQDKMFPGMQFYLSCIQNNNPKYHDVTVKAIKRLIDIFLRPLSSQFPKSATQYKVKNWLRLSKAFDGLKNSRLKCFSIQLIQIYGRMKSLNILEPDILEIKVKEASSGRTFIFNLPRYTSLWKFRLLIDEKFELNHTNFDIQLVQQRTRTNLQRQEDLSIAFIVTAKQKNAVSVIIYPAKEQHPHFKAIDKFKQQLCDMIGQGLYKNLSSKNEQKSAESLEILYKLPFIKTLQKSIQSLDFKQWNQIIDGENMKRIEYQLKVIQKAKQLKWIISFINKNGLKHLAQVILMNVGRNMNNYKTLNMVIAFMIEAIKFTQKIVLPFDEKFLKDILFYEKQVNNWTDQIKQEYVSFLLNCFSFIREVSAKVKMSSLLQKEKIVQILQLVLFSSKKSSISSQMIDICKLTNSFGSLTKVLRYFISFDFLVKNELQCKAFFEVIRLLLQKGQAQPIVDLLEQLLIKVRYSDLKEKDENQPNQLLEGYLSCIYEIVKNNPNAQSVLKQSKKSFYLYLLNECLFHSENISNRKFKSKNLRQLGFKLLQILQLDCKKDPQINKLLIPLMARGAWRKQYDWAIQPVEIVNKKFTGLKNLAATCYINSLLQQLFYIKNFSSQLMNVDSDTIDDKQNIVREIQNIFGFLKYSQNPSYTTSSLCQNFILDGQPIDPRVQTDVDEFFHALMDKLERNLAKINKKDIINEVFRGQFSNMIIGQQCPHASQRIEHFLSIRLQIKNKKTIYQALDEFIKGEVLEGQNSYFCQKCDKKVKALKRVCLKDLPQVMIVTLKRFEFDYDTMQKFKLNTYCSFPQQINFYPYTKEGLQQQSDAKKEDYQYKLKGVVIHYGISQAGHYTSYVRTDDQNWNYFDDERISQFNLNQMEKQCFGGIEQNPFGDDEEKKKNAYLLIYEKVKPSSQRLKIVPQKILSQSKVYKFVEQDNIKTKVINLLFQTNIENYIFNSSDFNWKTFLIYFHTVFLRNAKKKDKYVQFYNKATQILSKKPYAEWYLKQINESFLLQFGLWAEYEIRFIVISLICHAMKLVVDLQLMQQCVGMLNLKSITPFVKIFSYACQFQPQYLKFLTGLNFSQVILNLMKGKEIKQNSVIKKSSVRKELTQFGLAASAFTQRRLHDPTILFQAIQGIKIGLPFEEIKQYAAIIKLKRTLRSLAIITSRKYRQIDQLKKFNDSYLINQLLQFDPKAGQQSYYWYLIQVVEEFCKISDKDQQKRIAILTKIYIEAMKDALVGFKCELMLFNGLFRMSLINPLFRASVSSILNEKQNKKFVSLLKDWLKELPNTIQNIKNQKWGWWKKPKKNYGNLTTKDVQNDVKPNIKDALSLLNSIIEKHQIEQISQNLDVGNVGYVEQKYGPEFLRITRKMGLLIEVKDEQGNHRWLNQDEVIKKFV